MIKGKIRIFKDTILSEKIEKLIQNRYGVQVKLIDDAEIMYEGQPLKLRRMIYECCSNKLWKPED